jgi:hypothetical protein
MNEHKMGVVLKDNSEQGKKLIVSQKPHPTGTMRDTYLASRRNPTKIDGA